MLNNKGKIEIKGKTVDLVSEIDSVNIDKGVTNLDILGTKESV